MLLSITALLWPSTANHNIAFKRPPKPAATSISCIFPLDYDCRFLACHSRFSFSSVLSYTLPIFLFSNFSFSSLFAFYPVLQNQTILFHSFPLTAAVHACSLHLSRRHYFQPWCQVFALLITFPLPFFPSSNGLFHQSLLNTRAQPLSPRRCDG